VFSSAFLQLFQLSSQVIDLSLGHFIRHSWDTFVLLFLKSFFQNHSKELL